MTDSKPIVNSISAKVAAKKMPHLPPPAISAAAAQEGTKITIFFLAIENFSNRYPALPFITQSLTALSKRLKDLLTGDPALSNQVRQFILGMPLDTISASAHPKRLKQLLLESLLNPESLSCDLVRTDHHQRKTTSALDLIHDLQFYGKLHDLCSNPHYARELLSAICQGILLLKSEERTELKQVVEKLAFYHPTDRTFILKHLKAGGIIRLRSDQIVIAESKPIAPSRPTDYALNSILLFRRFKSSSEEIVARAGETLEAIQARANMQQREYHQLVSECKQMPAEEREKIHQHVSRQWPTFASGNQRHRKELNDFLNVLANPR